MRNKEKTNAYLKKYRQTEKYKKYNREYRRKYRKRIRRILIKLLGGKCKECGSRKNLDLHHKTYNNDLKQKSKIYLYQKDDLEVLCRRCHIRKHRRFIMFEKDKKNYPLKNPLKKKIILQ